jgi:hypothetical protein
MLRSTLVVGVAWVFLAGSCLVTSAVVLAGALAVATASAIVATVSSPRNPPWPRIPESDVEPRPPEEPGDA